MCFVTRYKKYDDASAAGLVSVDPTTNAVTLSVDTTNTYSPDGSQGGRPSVRIESKDTLDQGLVIGDFAHMPGSVCGSWPACEYLDLDPWLLNTAAHPRRVPKRHKMLC